MKWGGGMHYKLTYEITEEVIKKVTDVMLQMYEEHKDDDFFVNSIEKNNNKQ